MSTTQPIDPVKKLEELIQKLIILEPYAWPEPRCRFNDLAWAWIEEIGKANSSVYRSATFAASNANLAGFPALRYLCALLLLESLQTKRLLEELSRAGMIDATALRRYVDADSLQKGKE